MDLEPDFAVRYRALGVLVGIAEDEDAEVFDRISAANAVLDAELDLARLDADVRAERARLDADKRAESESLREQLLDEIAEDLHKRIAAQP